MTTFISFQAPFNTAMIFYPVLDGNQYVCSVRWNLFAQRFFILCGDGVGNNIFNVPMVGSPIAVPIKAISWSAASLRVMAVTPQPHKWRVGTVVVLTLDGFNPTDFNGTFKCYIDSPTSFFYTLNFQPAPLITLGTASYYVSMTKGYFQSTLIYRNGQFEVNP